jgi:hypothetical protein
MRLSSAQVQRTGASLLPGGVTEGCCSRLDRFRLVWLGLRYSLRYRSPHSHSADGLSVSARVVLTIEDCSTVFHR